MARFRNQKAELLRICNGTDWKPALEHYIGAGVAAVEVVSPLLSLLPRFETIWQAAYGIGLAVSSMAKHDMESARTIMRRLMWSMNEESGNLGWGIPEAMGCILAKSPALAREYCRILISYGRDTGWEDNFVEHAPLRRGVYWGIGHLAASDAVMVKTALPHLVGALVDEDASVRSMAAFALQQLAGNLPEEEQGEEETSTQWCEAEHALKMAATWAEAGTVTTDFFDGQGIVVVTLTEMLKRAQVAVRLRCAS